MNHSATPKAILTKVHDCTCNLNVYIFYLRFALGEFALNRTNIRLAYLSLENHNSFKAFYAYPILNEYFQGRCIFYVV